VYLTGQDLLSVAPGKDKDALFLAVHEESDLEIMVQYYLQTALNRIFRAKSYDKIVFDVIEWSNTRGKVSVLLQGASETNPDNPAILSCL
jgi:hypothetical protein